MKKLTFPQINLGETEKERDEEGGGEKERQTCDASNGIPNLSHDQLMYRVVKE